MACKGWEGEDFSPRNRVLASFPGRRCHDHTLARLNGTPLGRSGTDFGSDNTDSKKIIALNLIFNYSCREFESSGFNLHPASGNFWWRELVSETTRRATRMRLKQPESSSGWGSTFSPYF